jgi:hypothetical protein
MAGEKGQERNDGRERAGNFGGGETVGKNWREKKGRRERAGKFGGKSGWEKKKQC